MSAGERGLSCKTLCEPRGLAHVRRIFADSDLEVAMAMKDPKLDAAQKKAVLALSDVRAYRKTLLMN